MSCAYPMWRIPEESLRNHPLWSQYQHRIHNAGVIIQRPEMESIKKCYPVLFDSVDQIPCGKCIQCRIAYSREWANRCMCEYKTSVNAYFITLTYDTAHLHFNPYVDPDSGEVSMRPVLWPADLRNFMKRLRFWCSERSDLKQRFFACGEYGDESNTQRPHYHLIVYNLPPEFEAKKHEFKDSKPGTPLWTCAALDELWPDGIAVFGDVTWDTCAYVARYVVKKRKGKDRSDQIKAQELLFPDDPWIDEFVRMSRMPGIGREFYEQKKASIYATDEMFVSQRGSVVGVRPAKYYDRLFDIEDPDRLVELKQRRKKVAEQMQLDVLSRTDLNEVEYLDLKRKSKEDQVSRLVRPSI